MKASQDFKTFWDTTLAHKLQIVGHIVGNWYFNQCTLKFNNLFCGIFFVSGSATGITAYFNSATSSFRWWVIKLIFFVFLANLLGNWNINEIIQGIAINFPSCTSWWANLDRWKLTYFYSLPVCNVSLKTSENDTDNLAVALYM